MSLLRGDGDFMAASEVGDFFLIQNECLAGFQGEDVYAGTGAGFYGLQSDARNVETHVVFFFGDFGGDGAAGFSRKFATARETFIAAFQSLDGQDGAVFDDDELADVEARDFPGDAKGERDIGLPG